MESVSDVTISGGPMLRRCDISDLFKMDLGESGEVEKSKVSDPDVPKSAQAGYPDALRYDLVTREDIDAAIAGSRFVEARIALSELFTRAPTLANAQVVLTRFPKIAMSKPLLPVRLAILRSFTIEPVLPSLKAYALLAGIELQIKVGEFNTYSQEIIDPSSWLYSFDPDVVVLAIQARDLSPDLWGDFTGLSEDVKANLSSNALNPITSLLGLFRSRTKASLIIHSLEQPVVPNSGLLDSTVAAGQRQIISDLNRSLQLEAGRLKGVYVLDYDALVARHGRERWHDEQKWLTARLPIAADCLGYLALEYMRFLAPISGKVCKALVVDLDNTLWGGVIGEDGMAGVKLSPEYPGAAFQATQRVILDLYQRGIILAIASKNNLADAMEALENHPEMVLRPRHFAALRINWNDKAQSLREISAELNIGIDSLAFLDDNPVERRRIRTELPDVTVLDLPENPMLHAAVLRSTPVFERLVVTNEDQERGRLYAEQRERKVLESTAGSLEDYYISLEMKMRTVGVTQETLARIAQLTQKTNQFNTTTRRYSEQEVEALAGDSNARVIGVRVADRFGDNGLVGVAVLRIDGKIAEIDTFLLSCRVIGRTVETAMLAELCDLAQSAGCRELRGWFLPTNKNAPAAAFYETHGFLAASETPGGMLWTKNIQDDPIFRPRWIK